ncbi:MAG: hypothetical protein F4X12_07165 [Acidobacteriia bacterium]|nr:hypothetical protein [Terriglobia bacterium]
MPSRIFTVGFDLPGDEFEHVPLDSDQSLLDADIVLFEPSLPLDPYGRDQSYNGRRLLGERDSVRYPENARHWASELVAATNAGKLVIVYLTKPELCYRHTGEQTFSGTGRSRVTTDIVTDASSYDAVPQITSVQSKSGREVKLTTDASLLAPYWREFGSTSPYEAFIDGEFTNVLITTKAGANKVGALVRGKGTMLLLPPLRYNQDSFVVRDEESGKACWSREALRFGKRLVATLTALSDAIRAGRSRTPPPRWAQDGKWTTEKERDLLSDIASATASISELHERRTLLEQSLEEAGSLRGLLYEQGPPLEAAVREALGLFGFSAKPFRGGDSEFDVVFESAEGRCLGEVEGKDSRAINVAKLSQLERNLQEDFARDDVTTYAKGVLFGNAERLVAPADRNPQTFTAKCATAAKRSGIALVRTMDLFEPSRYLRETGDEAYAASCREAICMTTGEVVVFPVPPVSSATVAAEPSS